MKKYSTFLILSSILFLTWTAFTPPTTNLEDEDWKEKISSKLMTKALRGEALDFLVILKNQKNVNDAPNFKTKEARGNFVYKKLKSNAQADQKNILQILQSEKASYRSFFIINAIQVKGDFKLLKKLAKLSKVNQLTDNSPIQFEEPISNNFTNERGPNTIEWGVDMIDAEEVWALGFNGQNVIVGGQDTGYDWTHPALSEKYRGNGITIDHNYNWHDAIHEINANAQDSINPCGLDVQYPCDDHNHGTHTMGTMVGEDNDNQIGVAPGAKWIACRNMERGNGTPATYIECFEWFMAPTDLNNENPDVSKAPHVIANSWSCPTSEGCDSTNWHVMEAVVQNLKASGVVVVVSAGNSGGQGCGSVSTPSAIFEASFSVGATAQNDMIAGFSSRGPVTVNGTGIRKPDVSAPGVAVRSCVRDSSYATYSGTSMAGPHTAGLVALMISANPNLAGQVEVIEDIIELTSIPKTDTLDCGDISSMDIPNNIYGYGRINALAAVNEGLNFTNTNNVEVPEVSLKIFPNPTSDLISFEFFNLSEKTILEIFDATGRLLQSHQIEGLEYEIKNIRMDKLASGVYFYKIKNTALKKTGKVFKN
ncbi:MAG: S8 family peptidase [Saprospiraceae bacterium]|nr:S8 family peptidase [Saprospiraceae bacterium]